MQWRPDVVQSGSGDAERVERKDSAVGESGQRATTSQTPASRDASTTKEWTDVELVNYALRRAGHAAQQGYMRISAEYYAVIYKILRKKCDVIDTLVQVALKHCEDKVAADDGVVAAPVTLDATSHTTPTRPELHLMLLPPGLDPADYEAERRVQAQGGALHDMVARQQHEERRQRRLVVATAWVVNTLRKVHPDALPLAALEEHFPRALRGTLRGHERHRGGSDAVDAASPVTGDTLAAFMPVLKSTEGGVGGRSEDHVLATLARTRTEDDRTRLPLAVLLAALLWNTANTLWQDGYVAETAVWLRRVDVAALQRLVRDATPGSTSEEDDVAAGEELHWCTLRDTTNTTAARPRSPSTAPRGPPSRVALARRLLHHVTALRDWCAILEACESASDVLSYVRALDVALCVQQRHVPTGADVAPARPVRYRAHHHPELESVIRDSPTRPRSPTRCEPASDCMAEVLVTLNIVVEYFLSTRAMALRRQRRQRRVRHQKLLLHSDSYTRLFDLDEDVRTAPTDAAVAAGPRSGGDEVSDDDDENDKDDMAVRRACDELVSTFTAGYYATLEALETDGLPARETAPTVLAPGLSFTLAVNVLSCTLNYVAVFHLSKIHRGVVAAHATSVMRTESPRRAPSSSMGSTQVRAKSPPQRPQHPTGLLVGDALRLPSRVAVGGVRLLAEESLAIATTSDAAEEEEASLRLLVLLRRYRRCHTLEPIPSAALAHTAQELNKALYLLQAQMRQELGEAWWTPWQTRQHTEVHAFYHAALAHVCAHDRGSAFAEWVAQDGPTDTSAPAVVAGPRPATLSAWWGRPLQKPPSVDALQRKREASTTTTVHTALDVQRTPAHPATAPWGLPPLYTPDITVDFSAFTTSSVETQLATREMVAERVRRQQELQAGQQHGLEQDNTAGVSVLSAACRRLLHDALPIAAQYSPWRVIYSTALHGVSLQTLLTNCEREHANAATAPSLPHWRDSPHEVHLEREFLCAAGANEGRPTLLVLELTPSTTYSFAADGAGVRAAAAAPGQHDVATHRLLIGAYLSHLPCRESRRYYGTAETFVFQLLLPQEPTGTPQLRTYHASGHNHHFLNCRPSSIVVGGGGAGSSLFLDDSLWHGATAACATFKSAPPLTEWATEGGAHVDPAVVGGTASFEVLQLEVIVVDC